MYETFKINNNEENRIDVKGSRIKLYGNEHIDVGGIGKGYLLKLVSQFLTDYGFSHHLINGGGDIYVTSDFGKPVDVYIKNPFDQNEIVLSLKLYNQSVCVSSPDIRKWKKKDGIYTTHLVYPSNFQGKQSSLSGSVVIGDNPTLADGLATVFCLIDEEYCQKIAKNYKVKFKKYFPKINS